jgi:hypothetical protein
MNIGKTRKGIIRNGVLVSMMAFYFSCGKDVFPPDSPGEMGFHKNAKIVLRALNGAGKKSSPCAEHLAPCTAEDRGMLDNTLPEPRIQPFARLTQVTLHLQQLGHQDGAARSAANRIVR